MTRKKDFFTRNLSGDLILFGKRMLLSLGKLINPQLFINPSLSAKIYPYDAYANEFV